MYYQTKNPHGGDIYASPVELDYSANTNPLGVPPAVIAAAAQALEKADRYPDPYCRSLVKAIAEAEGVQPEYILCGNGASELIFAFCAAAQPGKAAALAPTFSEYASALELFGGNTVLYPLRQERGFLPGEDFPDWLRSQQPEAVFLCNPNNPTGRLLPRDLIMDVITLCKQMGARLFVDECFLELAHGGESLKGLLTDFPGLFLLRAFTKSYGMAGLRLGYCFSADEALLRRMAELTPPWDVSAPAQAAGVAALGEGEFLRRAKELIDRERPRLKKALEDLGLWVCPSDVNYLLFRGPESLLGNMRLRGVALRDCANFPGLGPGWYRMAVRTEEENDRLLAALKECL
jgi:threonine-phosphate decarboxylase